MGGVILNSIQNLIQNKMPTEKELEQLENSKSTFKEIMKVHMREPFTQSEVRTLLGNIKRLKEHQCEFSFTKDIIQSIQKSSGDERGKLLEKMMSEGYLILVAPQIGIRILYVKVYGGKGMLWGKKIHYAVYQQDYDEKTWTPLGTFKIWGLAVTGINNIFRSEGLLKGSAL
jgi:hypothetical protein